MIKIINEIFIAVLGYLKADWLVLLIGILLAAGINVYADSNKLKWFFERKSGISIPGAVVFGSLTPLCACGTMAVLLSMFVSSLPWGTVMAFLVSSPLTSPSEYVFETAFLGSRFASGLLIASIVLGLMAGFIAHFLEKRSKFFKGQFRLIKEESCCRTAGEISCSTEVYEEACSCEKAPDEECCSTVAKQSCSCRENIEERNICCGSSKISSYITKYKVDKLFKELYHTGIKKILFYFILFIAAGRIVELIIPKEWILSLFSGSKAYSIPLAATIGLPLYLTDASALPILRSFINSGAGEGAVMAFLIAGKATGVPVIAGMSTILKKRALLFYVGFIYLGAILAGFAYQLFVNLKF